ncbi:hypothetical protein GRI72_09400 [Altererythrobacter marinus]|uniref:Uncharacterized protein n=1 Tax=Pelagerythrobacter marinus TaxID=538382 RepID=A0ABW9UW09_9SPHN|nr:hypothetical protein [Pelagerythrobacter marinus]MXO69039.1 hypothetical protein [Pelagerythrobacter marinus]
MPQFDINLRPDRERLLRKLCEYAKRWEGGLRIRELTDDLNHFAKHDYEPLQGDFQCPERETVKNWMDGTSKSISPKHAHFIGNYLELVDQTVFTIDLGEHGRLAELLRFFGSDPKKIDKIGHEIDGDWLMYRRWREPLGRYIVSPVNFEFIAEKRVITSVDCVHLRQPGAHFHDAEEKWEGVAIPMGRYTYFIHRCSDSDNALVNNVKFTVIDEHSYSSDLTVHETNRLHIMSGFTTIGVNMHPGGNSFVTVLERVAHPREFSENPIPWSEIPPHIQDHLERLENKT